jgi:hypothetical protein
MGDAAPRLRGHWLYGLSSEAQAIIDGRLICDHRFDEEPPSGGFSFVPRGETRADRCQPRQRCTPSSSARYVPPNSVHR